MSEALQCTLCRAATMERKQVDMPTGTIFFLLYGCTLGEDYDGNGRCKAFEPMEITAEET